METRAQAGLTAREESVTAAVSAAICWAIVFAQGGRLFNLHDPLGIAIALASIPVVVAAGRWLKKSASPR
ncbi:MAG: hypothetical protein K6V73_06405 [Firmicutes bacterium]|nr:hypothetical protein [Bacillota bacterium]